MYSGISGGEGGGSEGKLCMLHTWGLFGASPDDIKFIWCTKYINRDRYAFVLEYLEGWGWKKLKKNIYKVGTFSNMLVHDAFHNNSRDVRYIFF